MTNIINLTPHTLNIHDAEGNVTTVAASGAVARVATTREQAPSVAGLPVTRPAFGEVEGLPDPEQDTVYIVSGMVLAQVEGRTDVYAPGELLRDDAGRVIGCKGLSAPAPQPHGATEAIAYWYSLYQEVAKQYGDQVFVSAEKYVQGSIKIADVSDDYKRVALITKAAVSGEQKPQAVFTLTEGHDYRGLSEALEAIGLKVNAVGSWEVSVE